VFFYQPSQNEPAAGSTNRLLCGFDRLLAVRKGLIFTNNKEKRKKKEKRKELLSTKGKSLNIIQKALVQRAYLHPLF